MKELPGKNWDDPDVGRDVDSMFKTRALAEELFPKWVEPMFDYPKIVEWMRRQHWKYNKNKLPQAHSSVVGVVASGSGGVGASASAGEEINTSSASMSQSARLDDSRQDTRTSGYWNDVL